MHFIWLTCIAIVIFLLCRIYLRLTKIRQLQMLNITVLLALCCTFTQDAILTVTGHMNARMLPFHLCDLAGFFYLLCKCRHYAPDAGVSFQKSHCAFLCLVLSLAFYFRCGTCTHLSLYDDPWFCISCADHSLSMVTFCQWKHSP